ncbi:MAG: hypothetical protein L6R39_003185 [Caloplaca ligustica]|nr:MAG: hypothetical protein L6R39_003185 [Caloplaca ligustica]
MHFPATLTVFYLLITPLIAAPAPAPAPEAMAEPEAHRHHGGGPPGGGPPGGFFGGIPSGLSTGSFPARPTAFAENFRTQVKGSVPAPNGGNNQSNRTTNNLDRGGRIINGPSTYPRVQTTSTTAGTAVRTP